MNKIILSIISIFILFGLFHFTSAQDFTQFSAEDYIQLKLDLMRKGIQQEDTCKILLAFSNNISTKDKHELTKVSLSQRLQTILNNGSKRDIVLPKPKFPRTDSRLSISNFWDFDIINTKIELFGDSAIVNCELVLWGEVSNDHQKRLGQMEKERFVFKSSITSEKDVTVPDSSGTFTNKTNKLKRSWQLVGFNNLLDFLEKSTNSNTINKSNSGEL